ncbi:MAG: rane protein of unknown function [Candidatus Saccharibacteria bacterium]|nr:rane protein of unknown function [Candidatus Saccharibacteria bacterium]
MIKGISTLSTFLRLLEKYWWLLLIVCVGITYVLIMLLARGQNVWFDEGYSIILAKQPFTRLLALTGVDAHPPLYYLLLRLWGSTFNWSEFALRSLSAVAASGTVGVMILLVRRLFMKKVALLTMPFLVLSPFFLRYGYEIRMYALVGLIGVVATLFLVTALQTKKKKWWILYSIFVALGMYTLYMSVVIWLAHFVWLLVRSIKQKDITLKQPWIKAYIGAVILFLPYVPTFLYQMTHSALPGIGSVLTIDGLGGVLSLMMGYIPSWQIGGILSIALLLFVGLGIYLTIYSLKKMPQTNKQWFWLLLICFLLPLAFYIVTSLLPKPFFIPRYMAHIVIFFYGLIGIISALGWRYGKRITAIIFGGLAIILLTFGVVQVLRTGNFNFERLQMPETTSIRSVITCDSSSVVMADDPYTYIDSAYYFDGCNLRFYSPENINFSGGYAPLHDSGLRVSSAESVHASTLYVLHWVGSESLFQPSSHYSLKTSQTFNKQVVDYYVLQP